MTLHHRHYSVPQGNIHYWLNDRDSLLTLVFLPGLTADHRLFEKQVEQFSRQYRVLVWDAPGHGESRPFDLDFSLMDKARWLHGILEREQLKNPILIGQSMGGYVSQCFLELYPREAAGSAKSYNKRWQKESGLPLHWIRGAGHNSNTDRPEEINGLIADFLATLPCNPARKAL